MLNASIVDAVTSTLPHCSQLNSAELPISLTVPATTPGKCADAAHDRRLTLDLRRSKEHLLWRRALHQPRNSRRESVKRRFSHSDAPQQIDASEDIQYTDSSI